MAVLKFSEIAAASDNLAAGDFLVGVKGGTTDALFQIGGGTVTTSDPILDMSQTWNAGGVTFTALKLDVTNTASAGGSLLMDLKVGGSSVFTVRKDGRLSVNEIDSGPTNITRHYYQGNAVMEIDNGVINISSGWKLSFGNGPNFPLTQDLHLAREAAGTLALHHATLGSASSLHVYNTTDAYSGAPTNYERGVFDWTTTANTLTIGTQAGGTGTLRPLAFVGANYQFASAGGFTANATTATVLGSVGPAGASTAVQKWLTIKDDGGTVRYIPCF